MAELESESSGPLVRTLQQLTDVQARRANLRELLTHLSPWELWDLKNRIREYKLPFATLVNLPPEVLTLVGEHLDLIDLAHCTGVSKSWRAKWKHEAVMTALCRHFFPGLIETSAEVNSSALFHDTSRKYVVRAKAKYTAYSHVPFEWTSAEDLGFSVVNKIHSDFGLTPATSSSDPGRSGIDFSRRHKGLPVRYSHGRVVWQHELAEFIVDDLHTKVRRVLRVPRWNITFRKIDLFGVSKDLIVTSPTASRTTWCVLRRKTYGIRITADIL
jgi:F-box domain